MTSERRLFNNCLVNIPLDKYNYYVILVYNKVFKEVVMVEVQLEKESYTSRELMFLLNMSYMSIYRLVKAGKLHPVKVGNKHLFLKEDIERFIREEQEKRAAG